MIRDLPILLQPSLRAFKNRWKSSFRKKDRLARDSIILVLCFAFVACEYWGGIKFLNLIEAQKDFLFADPHIILNLMIFFLLLLLVFSNFTQALNSLYTGKDLDLILASPIPASKFYIGKFLEVIFSTSWMAIMFIAPLLLVLKSFYDLSSTFLILSTLLLFPLFVIPTSISFIVASIYPLFIPKRYSKELLYLIAFGLILGFLKLLNLITMELSSLQELGNQETLKLASTLTIANKIWLPSYWIASSISELIYPLGRPFYAYIILSFSSSISLFILGLFLTSKFHFLSFSRVTGGISAKKIKTRNFQGLLSILSPFIDKASRSILSKDYKLFSRDISQAGQSAILLGLSSTYLYILQSQRFFQAGLASSDKDWWGAFLSGTNSGLEAFILMAIGTRLVYPTISLEGSAFWLLHSSPLSIKHILQAKLKAWFLPISIIFGLMFSLATWALSNSLLAMTIKIICTVSICYGVTGLAIGFGAYFCNFSWDHSSELAAGFGSLLYMLTTFVLICFNLGVITLMLSRWKNNLLLPEGSDLQLTPGLLIGIAIIISINYFISKIALSIGEKSMVKSLS